MIGQARVVIIGGGSLGVNLLYHLTREGWTDICLIEKGELTSGSTWPSTGSSITIINIKKLWMI